MTIKNITDGYQVDVRPQGRAGKRIRKKFKTKAEAMQFEKWVIATQNSKGWIEKSRDRRKLTELIDLWFHYHGQTLKSGVTNKQSLLSLAKQLGNPSVCHVTKQSFSDYRAIKLAEGYERTTLNRRQALLSGVFSALIKVNEFNGENPLQGLSKLKLRASEMGYLDNDDIKKLLFHLDGDALKIAKVSLATGGRWSEVSTLRGTDLVGGKIIFHDTKNNKNRTVPISDDLYNEIKKPGRGMLFSTCYKDFYSTLKELDFDLPKGQAAHVLRHTFASHFVMNGGNILTLQKILGHSTINQTMAYAHLAPDYLIDAVKLNPLENLK
ncbi:phage integrase [Photobacterium carnosum]|uniref:phage integrase n=1 Tax=Photobacterium carnosum TaxID=2023717 RepID=UPI00242D549A|nr:tyrosine-type recombinase/integrase [Photobacterium carnosum]